jgi:hypothetical protein
MALGIMGGFRAGFRAGVGKIRHSFHLAVRLPFGCVARRAKGSGLSVTSPVQGRSADRGLLNPVGYFSTGGEHRQEDGAGPFGADAGNRHSGGHHGVGRLGLDDRQVSAR